MAIANVTLSYTFDQWRMVTNQLVGVINDIDANGNLMRTNASAGLWATANIGRGGLLIITANLVSNVHNTRTDQIATANLTNALHGFVRTAFNQANSAYVQANNVGGAGNTFSGLVFNQANTARNLANTAMIQANTVGDASNTFTKLAFGQANTGYAQANAAYVQANAGLAMANLAYSKANTFNDAVKNNVTTLISKGYTINPYEIPNGASGAVSFTVDPAQGNYQWLYNKGAITITAPASDGAVDIMIYNDTGAGAITMSGFYAPSGGGGDAYVTNLGYLYFLMIRRIYGISTYSFKACQ